MDKNTESASAEFSASEGSTKGNSLGISVITKGDSIKSKLAKLTNKGNDPAKLIDNQEEKEKPYDSQSSGQSEEAFSPGSNKRKSLKNRARKSNNGL